MDRNVLPRLMRRSGRNGRWQVCTPALLCGLAVAVCQRANAVEYAVGDWRINLDAVGTIGTAIKTSNRNPALIEPGDGQVVGIRGRAAGGNNSVAGGLNYGRGDFLSSVVKGYATLDVSNTADQGVFVSGYGWYDYTQANSHVQLGNSPNGYVANAPLSDRGFDANARFGNAVLEQAYLHGKTQALGGTLTAKLGQQVIGWGSVLTVPGGVREIDPRNFAAQSRPGFQREEGYIPIPAVEAAWDITPQFRIEGFYQVEQAHSVLPGCGTYTSVNSFAPDGCNIVVAGATRSNRQSILANLVINRVPDQYSTNSGQFGLGASYAIRSLGTRISLYVAQYGERLPQVNSVAGRGLGFSLRTGSGYQIAYPNGTKVASLISSTAVPASRLKFALEVDQTVDQPFAYNGTDVLTAGLAGLGPFGARQLSAPPGTILRNYDRHATTQLGVGGEKGFQDVAGADEAILGVEVGGKFVEGLPPVSQRRYGRADQYGGANGPGVVCVSQITCSKSGFVTSTSWGYRLRGSLIYRNVAGLQGINVTPSITMFHDVNGTSSDGAFVEGRVTLRAAVDAQLGTRYFGNVSWTTQTGGTYNIRSDRDVALISVGVQL